MVGYNCKSCAKRDKCNQRPEDDFIIVTRKTGECFVSQKVVEKVENNPLIKRKRKKRKS